MITIEGKYEIVSKLGEGTFGKIYRACNANTGKNVAVKFESVNGYQLLLHEAQIYVALRKCKGVSKLRAFGTYQDFNYIVIDLYEYDLEEVLTLNEGKLSMRCVLDWGHRILQILQAVHGTGIIHRDIKPENVMVRGENLFLVDFGLSRFYLEHSGKHSPMKTGKEMIGTTRYASCNVHDGVSASRRDDLESLAYTLLFLFHSTLPWMALTDAPMTESEPTYRETAQFVRELKATDKIDEWCAIHGSPPQLLQFLQYVKSLDFEAEPDYNFFSDFEDLKGIDNSLSICRTPESLDKSSGSTTSLDTDSSPL